MRPLVIAAFLPVAVANPATVSLVSSRLIQNGVCRGRILNELFEMDVDLELSSPVGCEFDTIADVIERQSLVAINKLWTNGIQVEQSQVCRDRRRQLGKSSLKLPDIGLPLSSSHSTELQQAIHRRLAWVKFSFYGGYRCNFCSNDNTDANAVAFNSFVCQTRERLYSEGYGESHQPLVGWSNGAKTVDTHMGRALGFIGRGRPETSKMYSVPKSADFIMVEMYPIKVDTVSNPRIVTGDGESYIVIGKTAIKINKNFKNDHGWIGESGKSIYKRDLHLDNRVVFQEDGKFKIYRKRMVELWIPKKFFETTGRIEMKYRVQGRRSLEKEHGVLWAIRVSVRSSCQIGLLFGRRRLEEEGIQSLRKRATERKRVRSRTGKPTKKPTGRPRKRPKKRQTNRSTRKHRVRQPRMRITKKPSKPPSKKSGRPRKRKPSCRSKRRPTRRIRAKKPTNTARRTRGPSTKSPVQIKKWCQRVSNKFGINHGVSYGTAPRNIRIRWKKRRCHTCQSRLRMVNGKCRRRRERSTKKPAEGSPISGGGDAFGASSRPETTTSSKRPTKRLTVKTSRPPGVVTLEDLVMKELKKTINSHLRSTLPHDAELEQCFAGKQFHLEVNITESGFLGAVPNDIC